ncbi:glycosyltransferase [Microbacterium sp.]|uniref:glycosyltransferase n=1 Tax=Microbacterium sp. TaxID=51671 RepID=UPI002BC4AED0|nr:glycosyltransferase [Microbacterium sp.]HWK76530.1 glycosyltransferase [Microbacterium sp.]
MTPKSNDRPVLRVAYVGPVDVPSSAANAQRMLGLAKALGLAGCEVVIGSAADNHEEAVAFASGTRIEYIRESATNGNTRIRRIVRGLVAGDRTIRWLNRLDPEPDVVILYGTTFSYLVRLLRWTRRRQIPLVLDVVEWYDPRHLPGGVLGPYAILNEIAMRYAKKAAGIIAISSFLADYYRRAGLPTVTVPPLFEPVASQPHATMPWNDGGSASLTIAYVGNPGKKDRRTLENLLSLPDALGSLRNAIRIRIVGVDRAQASAAVGRMPETLPAEVTFLGSMARTDAMTEVARADFTVLQRPDRRYTKAGFPTKIVESLILGTPPLANATSDLGKWLVDNENAIILVDDSIEALVEGVNRAWSSQGTFDRSAIATRAAKAFSPASWSGVLTNLLKDSMKRGL